MKFKLTHGSGLEACQTWLGICSQYTVHSSHCNIREHNHKDHVMQSRLNLKVLVTTIDAQWEGMGDVESARYELALLPPCPTIRVLSHSN